MRKHGMSKYHLGGSYRPQPWWGRWEELTSTKPNMVEIERLHTELCGNKTTKKRRARKQQ